MPVYCYRIDGTDEPVELVMSIAEMERREGPGGRITMEDGRTAVRDYATELSGRPMPTGTWPMKCDAAGCHPDQIPAMREHARRVAGVAVDFTSDGRAIFESPGQRKRYLRSVGLRDNNGGYGDP